MSKKIYQPVERSVKVKYPFIGEDEKYVSIRTFSEKKNVEVIVRLGKSVVDYNILDDTTPTMVEIGMSEKYALLRGQKALGGIGRGEMTIPQSAF